MSQAAYQCLQCEDGMVIENVLGEWECDSCGWVRPNDPPGPFEVYATDSVCASLGSDT